PLRAMTIGCDSTMYLITDSRIERIPSSTPAFGQCGIRNKLLSSSIEFFPNLGIAPGTGTVPGAVAFNTICHGTKGCNGLVEVRSLPCPKCKPITTIKKPIKVPGGGTKLVTLRLPPGIVNALGHGHKYLIQETLGKQKSLQTLRLTETLK